MTDVCTFTDMCTYVYVVEESELAETAICPKYPGYWKWDVALFHIAPI